MRKKGRASSIALLRSEGILSLEGLGYSRPSRELLVDCFDHIPVKGKPRRYDIKLPLHVLSPRQKEVIFCLFYDGLTEEETARTLRIARRSVRTHRDRALLKLRKTLESASAF